MMKCVNLSKCVGICLLGCSPLMSFTSQAITVKDSSSSQMAKPLTVKSGSNFSLSTAFFTGREYCQNVLEANHNCFPFQNASANSYMNVTFDDGSVQAIPMFQRKVVSLQNKYTNPSHVVVFNPHESKTIFDGNVYDMVGLFCDADRCKPWN